MLKKTLCFLSTVDIIHGYSHQFLLAFILIPILLVNGCVSVRRNHLKPGERILNKQELVGAKKLNTDDIESLYANRPNKKFPILPIRPYIALYYSGLKKFDPGKYEQNKVEIRAKYQEKLDKVNPGSKKERKIIAKRTKKIDKQNRNIKEGNLGMRMGEPLAVLDTTKERETVDKIKAYLHSTGYFNAEVDYTVVNTGARLAKVTYTIDRKNYYWIDSIFYAVPDEALRQILLSTANESFIQKNHTYNQNNIVKERDRINDLMLNSGYYSFSRQFVNFEIDTTFLGDSRIVFGTTIRNPPGEDAHKIYHIDSIIFTTDADIKGVRAERQSESHNRVNYKFYEKRYGKRLLDWRLFIRPDSLYSKMNTLETQRQFSNLDIFKFINVNYDTTGGKFIANVFTSPLQRYQTSTETGINVSQGLPGPFVNFNLKNRNTFKGMEVMELNGRVGFEGLGGVSEKGNGYSSLEYGANLSFTFPQFLFPLGEKVKSKIGKFNPQTKITSGLTFTDRLEYLRSNISSAISYTWQNHQRKIYNLTIADVSYIESDITDPDFLKTLQDFQAQGNNLINSFSNSFVSSTTFSVINNYNDYGNKKQKSAYLRYSIEAGGNLFEAIGKPFLADDIETFQFAKFRADYRSTIPINSKESLAYRFNFGYALPYGDNMTLPYEKFFFAGGSNSLRAWEPRRLGPGSYRPEDDDGNYSNNFEQQGEIIFETSIEFRHKIFGFVHGAIFVDAGNIWTIREDRSRPGAHFEPSRFFQEIAVGTGYGVRFDFNFLLMRFDAGIKVYDPSGPKGARFIGETGFDDPSYDNYKRLVFNIGIGYPF